MHDLQTQLVVTIHVIKLINNRAYGGTGTAACTFQIAVSGYRILIQYGQR